MTDLGTLSNTQQRERRRAQTVQELIDANRKERAVSTAEVVDFGGLLLLGLIALSGMGLAFGDLRYLVVGGLALVIGQGIAWSFARLGWPLWSVALAVFGVYVLIGPLLVETGSWFAVVVPSPDSVGDMITGSVQGWANLLATTVPVGSAQQLLVVPWVSGLVVGAVSLSIARRAPRAYLAALIGPCLLLVASIVVGTDHPAWALQGTAFAAVALLWGSYRQRLARSAGLPVSRRNRLGSTVALLLVTGILGYVIGTSSFVVGDASQRTVARDNVEPPVDLRDVASPLEQFRSYRVPYAPGDASADPDPVMFTVTGLEDGDLLRLAALDNYDGIVWHVKGGETDDGASSLFKRVGEQVPSDSKGTARSITVDVEDYTGPWVPSVGPLTSVQFDGPRSSELGEDFRYNLDTDTGVLPHGLEPGDELAIDAQVLSTKADVKTGDLDAAAPSGRVEPVEGLDELLPNLLTGLKVDASDVEKLRFIERRFQGGEGAPKGSIGYFSSGRLDLEEKPSLPGHSAQRMRTMLSAPYLLGDEEQYASAMALVADALGFPSRVVVGFRPGEVSGGGATEVRSSEITAWTEVAVEGEGWVPFFPTPTDKNPPTKDTQPTPPPNRLFPAPPEEAAVFAQQRSGRGGGQGNCESNCSAASSGGFEVPMVAKVAGAIVLPPVLVLGLVTALMALLKRRRRNSRRTQGTPTQRIAAGWADVCDLAVDLGDVVPAVATRRETAVVLGRPGVAALAQSADANVFGPVPPDEAAVAAYWTNVAVTREAILAPASRFERWKALVNPTSLRRGRRRAQSVGRPSTTQRIGEAASGMTDRFATLKGSVR